MKTLGDANQVIITTSYRIGETGPAIDEDVQSKLYAGVGCAESFPCGDTAAMDDVLFGTDGNVNDASRNRASSARSQTIGPHKSSRSVSLEWRRGSAVVLRRGNVEAAFGVKKE